MLSYSRQVDCLSNQLRNHFEISSYWLGHNSDPLWDSPTQGEETMEKKFAVVSKCDMNWYADQAAAEAEAKRFTQKSQREYFVMQAISKSKVPVPEIEIEKIG